MSQKEAKLQSEMVIDHSQQRPGEKFLLWATLNRTLSQRDGQKQKAMGLKKGVSDLIYHKDGVLIGIEVKYPGEKHATDHVKNQMNWGKSIIDNGGRYFIVTTVEAFWAVIKNEIDCVPGLYHIKDIEKVVNCGKKTVVF
jgi:hypothetical protein